MLKIAPPIWTLIYILLCVALSWSLGWPTIPGLPLPPLGMVLVAVCAENLNPTIVVMKSAQNGARTNDTGALYRARDRCILAQRLMRSETVVIVSVGFQDPTQMRLATDVCVIETLATDQSDQPFGKAILPG
jgi:hypothetical protein